MDLAHEEKQAYGQPGLATPWTSAAKEGVGSAFPSASRLWFTVGQGIINEVFFPRIDTPSVRDFGFIITDGQDFFSEEKHDALSELVAVEYGIPTYIVKSQCKRGRYILTKRITADPKRSVLLQEVELEPTPGYPPLAIYALITPHVDNQAEENSAWLGHHLDRKVAFASHGKICLALMTSPDMESASVGYVGASDGWQILQRDKRLSQIFREAPHGSVAITVHLQGSPGVLALGFGYGPDEAATLAEESLREGFTKAWRTCQKEWRQWLKKFDASIPPAADKDLWRQSCMILKSHMSKESPGAVVASLSIPWSEQKGGDPRAGYHMVWPRDLCEAAGAFLAMGAYREAEDILLYLQRTQESDGHWAQNMWADGSPCWDGIQMDETASPILLLYALSRRRRWTKARLREFWPMIHMASCYIICNGPVTPQGRWENDPGYSLFTLAAQISALFLAGEIAEKLGEKSAASYLKESADWWNESLEHWTYVSDTDLAKQLGIEGYYANIVTESSAARERARHPAGLSLAGKAEEQLTADALALVRFGIRAADDPRILSTVKAIDHALRQETPYGPGWYRYTGDRYGEKMDGSPFDSDGKGRLWSLLTGERAHYELAAGHAEEAGRLARTMAAFSSSSRFLPEQVWDQDDIPERQLWKGRPTGSAMPLVWAHAEYIKLCRSLEQGHVWDQSEVVRARYAGKKTIMAIPIWRFHNKVHRVPRCMAMRIETAMPAVVHWTDDNWQTIHDSPTQDSGLLVQFVDVNVGPQATCLEFTFYWPESQSWEGNNFTVIIDHGISSSSLARDGG